MSFTFVRVHADGRRETFAFSPAGAGFSVHPSPIVNGRRDLVFNVPRELKDAIHLDVQIPQAHQTIDRMTFLSFLVNGDLEGVKEMVRAGRGDLNIMLPNGFTPLLIASIGAYEELIIWIIKALRSSHPRQRSVIPSSQQYGGYRATQNAIKGNGSYDLVAYIYAKQHCFNVNCTKTGLYKCDKCKWGRYCGPACQHTDWPAHKADCKEWSAEVPSSGRRTPPQNWARLMLHVGEVCNSHNRECGYNGEYPYHTFEEYRVHIKCLDVL
jgi:hypothetical protein